MKRLCLCVGLSLLVNGSWARSEDPVPIVFDAGTGVRQFEGDIEGYDSVDYQLHAVAGQTLSIDFNPSNTSAYFNVLRTGVDNALHIGSLAGAHFEGEVSADTDYTIRVYLMRNAARRQEHTHYALRVQLTGGESENKSVQPLHDESAVCNRRLEWKDIHFHLTCTQGGSINTLRIVPEGLADNVPIAREVDGTVTDAELADLNGDGLPELYVYANSAGSGSYGSLMAYAVDRRKSLNEIRWPELTGAAAQGYQGHDVMSVVGNRLTRHFPVYRNDDINARPTGGIREIQYRLVSGKNGWALVQVRVFLRGAKNIGAQHDEKKQASKTSRE